MPRGGGEYVYIRMHARYGTCCWYRSAAAIMLAATTKQHVIHVTTAIYMYGSPISHCELHLGSFWGHFGVIKSPSRKFLSFLGASRLALAGITNARSPPTRGHQTVLGGSSAGPRRVLGGYRRFFFRRQCRRQRPENDDFDSNRMHILLTKTQNESLQNKTA